MNSAQLTGRLTKDIQLRQTQGGDSVTQFTLAVNHDFKDKNGNRGADFIECVAWKKTAELLEQYTHKGSRIGVVGRIQTRNYDNKNGERVYVTEVIVDRMEFLDTKQDSQQGQYNSYSSQQAPKKAPARQASEDPFAAGKTGALDITEDDLPF